MSQNTFKVKSSPLITRSGVIMLVVLQAFKIQAAVRSLFPITCFDFTDAFVMSNFRSGLFLFSSAADLLDHNQD